MTYPVDTADAAGLWRFLLSSSGPPPPPPLRLALLVTLGELGTASPYPGPAPPLFFSGLGIFSSLQLSLASLQYFPL